MTEEVLKEFLLKKFDPSTMPFPREEQLQKINEKRALQLAQLMKNVDIEKQLRESENPLFDVWQGHRHRDGIDTQQSYDLAAMFYTIAADKGNVEGMYNIGLLHKNGFGVDRDIKKAIVMFEGAASDQAIVNGNPNIGVAESQFMIGHLLLEGVGCEPNPSVAADWFERSSRNGLGLASNSLACMYNVGNGVTASIQHAVKYWKLAASRNVTGAMESLAYYFLEEGNKKCAKDWYQKALNSGSFKAKLNEEQFEKALGKENEIALDNSKIEEWEKENGLTEDSMILPERFLRMVKSSNSQEGSLMEKLIDVVSKMSGTKYPIGGIKDAAALYDLQEIHKCAAQGSKMAKILEKAMIHFRVGLMMLATGENDDEAIKNFAECLRTEHTTVIVTRDVQEQLLAIVQHRMKKNPKTLKSDMDRDTRMCNVFLKMNAIKETIIFLEKTIKLYPEEAFLHEVYVSLFAFVGEYKKGVKLTRESLLKFPSNIELHFANASHMRLAGNSDPKDVINAYQDFLMVAPIDHRKVPDCLYAIASEYDNMDGGSSSSQKKNMMMKYYHCGLEAEELQLSCFLPNESNVKSFLETIIGLKNLQTSEISAKKAAIVDNALQNESVDKKLMESFRLQLILEHREEKASLMRRDSKLDAKTLQNLKKDQMVASLSTTNLRPIMLKDMKSKKSRDFRGFVLHVTSIEDAKITIPSIEIIVEDGNGDVQRCFIYNVVPDEEVQRSLGVGCKVSIINPYLRIAVDEKPAIRVDNPATLVMHPDLDSCRFCGKGNGTKKCSICKKSRYCSKDCQTYDWKLLNHKIICIPCN